MDDIILGLLFFKDRTIYELRAKFTDGFDLMYSSSMGGIQAAIKKLISKRFIESRELVENGKYKKVYSLTVSGREEFARWVNSPFGTSRVRKPELAKLYYMGLSYTNDRRRRVEEHIASLKKYRDTLKLIYDEGESVIPPKGLMDLFKYQQLTVQYGIDSTTFEIEWFTKLLSSL